MEASRIPLLALALIALAAPTVYAELPSHPPSDLMPADLPPEEIVCVQDWEVGIGAQCVSTPEWLLRCLLHGEECPDHDPIVSSDLLP